MDNYTIAVIDKTGILNEEDHPVAFGKRIFFNAIKSAGGRIEQVENVSETNQLLFVIIGTLENNDVSSLISEESKITQDKPEGVFYQWRSVADEAALIVGGTDTIGLMYALSELAQRIEDKGLSVLMTLENTVEFPDNHIRGLDKFIKDEKDDSWFFSEDYWQYYIGQLAKNRFNRLTLITGYNDGSKKDFMMPVYPYLLKVPEFENIKPKNSLLKSPKEYLAQLRRIGEICHNYGLEFVFGIWSHGRSDELIMGLPQDPLAYTKYCSNGLRELIRQVPEIDGIQMRVNYESGVGGFGDTAENFWKEIITAVGDGHKERNGKLFVDLRAKGLTVKIREWVLETGMNLSVTSKYSWEGVGLPYHQTEMRKAELAMLDNNDKRQRYGYADFLYKSRDFEYINRLWGIGTMRIFTWADPDYVKRFSHTTSFGGAKGFQVTPPMARKQNDWNLFTNDSLVYYKWEDQRYWAWYELFGRLGYSKNTNPEVWQRTFKKHYGKSYEAVLEAYSAAGKVLPLITSSHLTYHPANYNWAEIESGGALFVSNNASLFHERKERTYQSAEPGDPGLFYSINDYVKDVLANDVKPKINPIQLADLYENFSNKILAALLKVNLEDIPENYKKEFATNKIDLEITAALSAYHSFKIKAATDFAFFQETQEKGYLPSSLKNMEVAKRHWMTIVALTQELYYENPIFLHDNGTWYERLIEIDKDISKLKELIGVSNNLENLSHWDTVKKSTNLGTNNIEVTVPDSASSKNDLIVTFKTNELLQPKEAPKVHYRIANMASGKFKELIMKWDGNNYSTQIPADYLNPEYDLLIYFTSFTEEGHVIIYPGLFHQEVETPYFVVSILD
ncbi:hypothetical protein [Namhaeicola litoreus]|uniref:Uncharacterized protein n=1 Tax=Namhaeicola litoreus TaxID=1052145 RepID=A0ABW3Y6B1_9FLAO